MPTNAASRATAPRMRSTSAASAASASGRSSGGVMRVVEPCLQDDLRRRPASRAARPLRPPPAGVAQRAFARPRSLALVDQRHRQARSGRRAARAKRARARVIACGVPSACTGRPTTSRGRPPLVDQRARSRRARRLARSPSIVVSGCAVRVSVLPDRDADAPRAEIEREDRRVRRHGARARHACPTLSDSREIVDAEQVHRRGQALLGRQVEQDVRDRPRP